MRRWVKGYYRTLRQYMMAPKTQYEWKYYGLLFILYIVTMCICWGGIYWYYE
ncbi:conserved domain protein [Megasphaera sp. UPII 135-E]|uniref:Uncharacterized protein n=1 Tax=Megasphaera hutchinsoni TaxID=1588748 RepID=A0A134CKP0_9FIRM|nr:conserved domain protein [Megasphaera sp. UPII 135-E]KXB92694.1 hypothetical protein HMPREF3182_00356 [Megasphaera hutchinsoni]